ncbi:hypothetical protein, partial [Staphylococcus pseudintermedius]|uniref:hypothetical protein n=1 Tax=Staphylococcus pseudintermedius TaxID=283734 RepID=UPI0036F3264E
MPTFIYAQPEEEDIGEFSSAVQRIFATSAIEVDRDVLNRIRQMIGVPLLPDDLPVQVDMLPASLTGQTSA